MMNCPLCGQAAHTRSSFQVSSQTKERYNQCTNIECGHTFVTHETFVRSVCRPEKISAAPPHPKGMQEQLVGNDSNLLIVFYVQIMPDDFVMQLHRF